MVPEQQNDRVLGTSSEDLPALSPIDVPEPIAVPDPLFIEFAWRSGALEADAVVGLKERQSKLAAEGRASSLVELANDQGLLTPRHRTALQEFLQLRAKGVGPVAVPATRDVVAPTPPMKEQASAEDVEALVRRFGKPGGSQPPSPPRLDDPLVNTLAPGMSDDAGRASISPEEAALELERKKLELERERLALERERLALQSVAAAQGSAPKKKTSERRAALISSAASAAPVSSPPGRSSAARLLAIMLTLLLGLGIAIVKCSHGEKSPTAPLQLPSLPATAPSLAPGGPVLVREAPGNISPLARGAVLDVLLGDETVVHTTFQEVTFADDPKALCVRVTFENRALGQRTVRLDPRQILFRITAEGPEPVMVTSPAAEPIELPNGSAREYLLWFHVDPSYEWTTLVLRRLEHGEARIAVRHPATWNSLAKAGAEARQAEFDEFLRAREDRRKLREGLFEVARNSETAGRIADAVRALEQVASLDADQRAEAQKARARGYLVFSFDDETSYLLMNGRLLSLREHLARLKARVRELAEQREQDDRDLRDACAEAERLASTNDFDGALTALSRVDAAAQRLGKNDELRSTQRRIAIAGATLLAGRAKSLIESRGRFDGATAEAIAQEARARLTRARAVGAQATALLERRLHAALATGKSLEVEAIVRAIELAEAQALIAKAGQLIGDIDEDPVKELQARLAVLDRTVNRALGAPEGAVYVELNGETGDGLYVRRSLVTNRMYHESLPPEKRRPAPWFTGEAPASTADDPVLNLGLEEATAFASRRHERLPTEEERKAIRAALGLAEGEGDVDARGRFANGFRTVCDPSDAAAASATPPLPRTPVGSSQLPEPIAAGLAWLARHQHEDGHWDPESFHANCAPSGGCNAHADTGLKDFEVGVTALTLLAFLRAGYTPQSPASHLDRPTMRTLRYGDLVRRGLKYLLDHQNQDGAIGPQVGEMMYNHAIGTLALAEALQITRDPTYHDPAQRAINFITMAQNTGLGWRYTPRCNQNDTSVTGWCILALKAGETAGLEVDPKTLEGGRAWVLRVTKDSGEVGYDRLGSGEIFVPGKNESWQHHPASMTAIGMTIRMLTEPRKGSTAILGKAAKLITEDLPRWQPSDAHPTVDFYYWHQATNALYQFDGPSGPQWSKWKRDIKDVLCRNQRLKQGHPDMPDCLDGSWDTGGVDRWAYAGGRIYGTAINVLTLETCMSGTTGVLEKQPAEGKATAEEKPAAEDARRRELITRVRGWLTGRRNLKCSSCGGKGSVRCSGCSGRGSKRDGSYCQACNGRGRFTCSDCSEGVSHALLAAVRERYGFSATALKEADEKSLQIEMVGNSAKVAVEVKYLGEEQTTRETSNWELSASGSWKALDPKNR